MLPALTLNGVIWFSSALGAFNGGMFLDFIDGLLPQMNRYPAPKSVLVMDNCSIHHIDAVAERCEQAFVFHFTFHNIYFTNISCIYSGVKLVYLPPYSPDFNPIEEMFSAWKAYVRRNGAAYRRVMASRNYPMIHQYLQTGVAMVATAENCRGWFRMYINPE